MRMVAYSSVLIVCSFLQPYQLLGQSLGVAEVAAMKKRSELRAEFEDLRFRGSQKKHSGFGLGLGSTEATIKHELQGVNDKGMVVAIPFSEIVSLRSVGRENTHIQLDILRFPDISPETLVALNPDCSELRKHQRSVRLSVSVVDNTGGQLSWFGQEEQYGDVVKVGLLRDMEEGITVRVRLPVNETWWAIPSVTRDHLCPLGSFSPLNSSTTLKTEKP